MNSDHLADAVRRIAWGYVLLHVNFHLGTLNLLPNWLGYVLILSALPILWECRPSALLLRPLGILLAAWEGLLWGAALFGLPFESTVLSLIAAAVSLYFHFQLLTDLAGLAERFGCPERRKILRLRTVKTLLTSAFSLPVPWEGYVTLATGAAVVNLIVVLWICSVLFSLRHSPEGRRLPEEAEEGPSAEM